MVQKFKCSRVQQFAGVYNHALLCTDAACRVSKAIKSNQKQEIHINLQHISKDYYLYLKTREVAEKKELIPSVFSEPVQIYNNIENGLGILGSYTNNYIIEEIPTDKRQYFFNTLK